jgi:hypothetical protein
MEKPRKTFADYLVVAISPILIMALVGSLAFFLIQVFYRGEMIHGIRWVMFWFVLAIVLVSRISIEQSKEHAWFYGGALAVTTWLYLAHTLSAPVLGAVLLAITWFCAHKLTVDCTLIKEDEDASGEGILQGALHKFEELVVEPRRTPPPVPMPLPLPTAEMMKIAEMKTKMRAQSRAPGRWIIYFSLLALPLFGLGQLLLPKDDPSARRIGFAFLAVYLSAALCLLMTTSFLGLRRYLRQRLVEMPTKVALSWIQCGLILIAVVLVMALILPRPDRSKPTTDLTYNIEHKEHHASEVALPMNPPGEGEGAPGDLPKANSPPRVESPKAPMGNGTRVEPNSQRNPNGSRNQPAPNQNAQGQQPGQSGPPGGGSPSDAPDQTGEQPQSGPGGNARLPKISPSGVQTPTRLPSPGKMPLPDNGPRLPGPPANGTPAPKISPPTGNVPRPGGNVQPPKPDAIGNIHAQGDAPSQNPVPPANPGQMDEPTRLPDGQNVERPPGEGIPSQGADRPDKNPPPEVKRKEPAPTPPPSQPPSEQPQPNPQNTTETPKPPTNILGPLLRVLLIVAIASLLVWVAIKYRKAIAEAIRSLVAAVREFFRKLFSFRWRRKQTAAADAPAPEPIVQPFATYENPFTTGKDRAWPPERLVIYTYAALRSWAKEHGVEPEPQQTPREFCERLIERFPDFSLELEQFSFFYSCAAFATRLPEDFDPESVRQLWHYMGDSVMVAANA